MLPTVQTSLTLFQEHRQKRHPVKWDMKPRLSAASPASFQTAASPAQPIVTRESFYMAHQPWIHLLPARASTTSVRILGWGGDDPNPHPPKLFIQAWCDHQHKRLLPGSEHQKTPSQIKLNNCCLSSVRVSPD